MARYFLLTLVFALTSTITFAQQTSLAGKITDGESGEELIGANVTLYKGGVLSTGASTDFTGNYSINVDPGNYDVEVSYIGYSATRITDVVIKSGQANKLDVQLGAGGPGLNLDEIVITEFKVPLIEQDNTTQGGIKTAEEISRLPTKNIGALAASTAGLSQLDEGDAISVRGSRSNGTDVYVDGIRVNANAVQSTDIEQLQVITGGIPANYGDVTGGVISITTKGPSSTFSGGVEVETSEYLDEYGYNDFRAFISGPILRKKSGESIIGFRFSASYIARKDDDAPATDVFVINDDKLAEIEANPIERVGEGKVAAAERLTSEDVSAQGFRPNEESAILNITGKIDARLSKNVDITLTGAYVDQQNKFTPAASWRLMNTHNNPTNYTDRYRGNIRFRHRLGGGVNVEDGEEAAKKASFIQNAQYILQFGYEQGKVTRYDPRHEDRFFDYGHVGSFGYEWNPAINTEIVFDPITGVPTAVSNHVDYSQTYTGYDPTTAANPVLANFNNIADVSNENDFAIRNGEYDTDVNIYDDFHTTAGVVYNQYNKSQSDLYTGNASVSFDLLPGGSDKGRHSIQVGLTYEQRFDRNFFLAPFGLWEVARQSANDRHILGIDTTNIIGMIDTFGQSIPQFGTSIVTPSDLRFYKRVRDVNNVSLNDYVNVQNFNPDQLSLDMFAPAELSAFNNLIDYYGYDHTGQKLPNSVTFDDFFSAKDEDGVRSFLVPANQPNYLAVYIQDKFTFKDVILRLGVRVDRYDANTKIMKDPYSLYEINNANEFFTNGEELPGAIEGDYKVYLEGDNSSVVKAFRDGDTWYDKNGTQVNSGTLIFGGEPVFPSLKRKELSIKDDGYDTSNSFEDYKPQINVMPRLAFSFPISDAANFFAHYDILVQRPQSNNLVTPLDYYYFYDQRAPENNASLRPERTVDYEVGFQQKLSNSSALKIAAYYKEMRDMIQLRTYLHVPVIGSYTSFGNLDFGTVKGFTLQYDLRRTGNIQASVNYTLQFAEGTGSDAESQRGLTTRGNLRYLYPLNFDERHRIVTSVDYRYASGKKYNGPRWFGKDIFARTGINIQAVTVSGRPYTVTEVPSRLGGAGTVGAINGARKPWNVTVNGRIDKTFELNKPKDGKRPLSLNVFFRVQNLFDFRNVVNVYSATGSPDDDGFISSNLGADALSFIPESKTQSYLDSYSWRVLNPNNYTLPRRMYVGASFFF